MNTADKYHHIKFATIEGSGDTLPDRRSTQFSVSHKSSKNQVKKVDYSDISMAMVRSKMRATGETKGRGKSLRASRFIETTPDSMLATMPGGSSGIGNGRMQSIDGTFKR